MNLASCRPNQAVDRAISHVVPDFFLPAGSRPATSTASSALLCQGIIHSLVFDTVGTTINAEPSSVPCRSVLGTQDVQSQPPAHVGTALGAALFLDYMWAERPARRAEASPWYAAGATLARRLLVRRTAEAPPVRCLSPHHDCWQCSSHNAKELWV